ncbi:hypothetical protein BOTBODRAFT_108992 [Botryobasidium botryosum FD-172 SS1]|uniref:L-tyrosine decarboxylase C-terminal domain-containing protein n=1 Tax=Botryobasidium botryosum (strain FD-172 SS1) TaxID=930990 RepID=A0A067MKD8_BOTB1|nr:hypothetical protein BOTBODRAFT_108992 [Botryobasidium botryosum FD-172 SS1]
MHTHSNGTYNALHPRHNRVGAWFMGPKGENFKYMKQYLDHIIDEHRYARLAYYPKDRAFITKEMQTSPNFQEELTDLDRTLKTLSRFLAEHSTPCWSPRYNAHMLIDASMPAMLGYITTMLFNPNNVATEAGPFTSYIEKVVGLQLCRMLGYNTAEGTSEPVAWGHIACDGSVANLESIWIARNMKFYPLSLFNAMTPGSPLFFVADTFEVTLCTGVKKLYRDCLPWELLNLTADAIMDLPTRLALQYGISSEFLMNALDPHLIQSVGKDSLERQFYFKTPKYMVSITKHYSWPKGAAITGIGASNIIDIPVDNSARMDIAALDRLLEQCLAEKMPIYAVTAIMGSTEHGAIDPLSQVCKLRQKYQQRGLSFLIHADGAWGGYFGTMLHEPTRTDKSVDPHDGYFPELALQSYTQNEIRHYKYADSFTLDPHKTGYIPYPAGGLCYRDGRMRHFITWTNPMVWKESDGDDGMGVYGVEGSKPGAAPVAAWVAHEVIGLHKHGYGALLGEAAFGAVKMYSHWVTMDIGHPSLLVVPFNMLPAEKEGADPKAIMDQRLFIRDKIISRDNLELVNDPEASALLHNIGSDLLVNAFACNFRINGRVNDDITEANYFNTRLYEELSISAAEDTSRNKPIILMSTTLAQSKYGSCADNFKKRLGLAGEQDLVVLTNTVMSPFPTDHNFSKVVADAFQEVAEKVMKECAVRNEVRPTKHAFIVQGTDTLYLVYLPMFHMASYRHQLILTADIPHSVVQKCNASRSLEPNSVFTICTAEPDEIPRMLRDGVFKAHLYRGTPSPDVAPFVGGFHLTNVRAVVNRPLHPRYLDLNYPQRMPFYLYGSLEEPHIDHILLRAPNAMITSSVCLRLDSSYPRLDFNKTLIAVMDNVYEHAMMPLRPGAAPVGFVPGATFKVSIYSPANEFEGPNIMSNLGSPLNTGTITLTDNLFVDSTMVNRDPGRKSAKDELRVSDMRTFDMNDTSHSHKHSKRASAYKGWKEAWESALEAR